MPATRREFLVGSSGSASAPAASVARGGCPPTDPAPPPSLAVHAANRLMYGPAAGDLEHIQAIGHDAFVAEQLNPAGLDDSVCDAILNAFPHATLSESWAQLYDRRNMTSSESYKPFYEVRHATVIRMAVSRRQLFERVVEFWHNHFNVYALDNPVRSLWPKWDQMIRANALGNFRGFLEQVGSHPCMLYYLDNYLSTDGGPNENYAREMFELHTLGAENYNVPGGYVDQDVYESSRCFTGWTYERGSSDPNRGQFKYVADDHDRFQKVVLGVNFPNDQPALRDGQQVYDLLAWHPGVARHLCRKLCTKFVSDNPPTSIVESAAAVWLANVSSPDQIKLVLAHILASEEFKSARMTKFKRPIDWVISAMRALNVPYVNHDAWYWLYNPMGMPLFEWRPPDGPPDVAARWATSNSMLQRWNWAYVITSGWYTSYGLNPPTTSITPPELTNARGISEWWAGRTFQRPISKDTQEALSEFFAEGRSWDLKMPTSEVSAKLPYLAALCVMAPEFMKR